MSKIRTPFYSLLLLALVSVSVSAQTRRISGRVTVEGSDEPLVGAGVSVVGTSLGTYSDDQGRFAVTVPDGPATLRVRHIGYSQKTVAVPAGATDFNIALAHDVLQLETQVVTGTATTVSSVNAANAVTVVSGEKLNRVPAQTIDYALQGKIPGALVTPNSGAPGGGVQIQLRGVSTINAQADAPRAGRPPSLVYTCLITNDVKQLTEFYERVLQVKPHPSGDSYVEFPTSAGTLAIFDGDAQEKYIPGAAHAGQNRSAILEFNVANVDQEYTRLQKIVKAWVKPPTTQPYGSRSFYFRDPDGNLVDFFSRVKP